MKVIVFVLFSMLAFFVPTDGAINNAFCDNLQGDSSGNEGDLQVSLDGKHFNSD